MVSGNPSDPLRAQVAHLFSAHRHTDVSEIFETILLSDGQYSGRHFISDNQTAVWSAKDNSITLYMDGQLLEDIKRTDDRSERAAA